MQVTFNRQFAKGVSLFANYVWSKTLSNVDSEPIGGNGANNAPMDYYNLKLEKSIASYDIPHAVKAYATYELPVGRGKKFSTSASRLADTIFGGWKVSGITNYFVGTPLGPFTAPTPLSGGWNGGNNRPIVSDGSAMLNPNFDASRFDVLNTVSASNLYFNKADFTAPAALALGTSAKRYSNIRSFPTLNEDGAIAKSIRITEKFRMSLRGEAFNAFNRHKLGGVSTSFSSANFGQVTSVSANRQMQVSARLDF